MSKRLPPAEYRFQKGVSGNPKGRPKGSRNKIKKKVDVFDERVSVTVRGRQIRMSTSEALIRYARDLAIRQDNDYITGCLLDIDEAMERARAIERKKPERELVIIHEGTDPPIDCVCCLEDALKEISAGSVLYPFRTYARFMLEPWLVEAALGRLGDRRFTREEQKLILRRTRLAWKVDWPEWWERDLRGRKRRRRRSNLFDSFETELG